jgi:hypothetical protein
MNDQAVERNKWTFRKVISIASGWHTAHWLNKPTDNLSTGTNSQLMQKLNYMFWLRTTLAYITLFVMRVAFNMHSSDQQLIDLASLAIPALLIPVGNFVMGLVLLALTVKEKRAQTFKDLSRPFNSALVFFGVVAAAAIPFFIFRQAYSDGFRGYSHSTFLILNAASLLWGWCVLVIEFACYQAPLYQFKARDGHLLLPAFSMIFVACVSPIAETIYGSITRAVNPLNQVAAQIPAKDAILRFGFEWAGSITLVTVCVIEILIVRKYGITVSGGSRGSQTPIRPPRPAKRSVHI